MKQATFQNDVGGLCALVGMVKGDRQCRAAQEGSQQCLCLNSIKAGKEQEIRYLLAESLSVLLFSMRKGSKEAEFFSQSLELLGSCACFPAGLM